MIKFGTSLYVLESTQLETKETFLIPEYILIAISNC